MNMSKDKKIRTPVFMPESLRDKANEIALQETGVNNISVGIRLAIKAFKLKKK